MRRREFIAGLGGAAAWPVGGHQASTAPRWPRPQSNERRQLTSASAASLRRRHFLRMAAGAAGLATVSHKGWAQAYPMRPVRIISAFAPGGITDLFARLMGQWFSEHLGQQFFVENRSGAGGTIGTEAVAKAAPDGYTLLLVDISSALNATLYDNLNFNFIRGIAPIAGIFQGANVLVVYPSFPAKSVPELITYAKANPGKISVASSGVGSGPHISGELFNMMAGVNMVQVQYRGAGPALIDMLGGQTQVMFASLPSAIEYVRSGRLRLLAVTTATRLETLPAIPTVGEFVPGYEVTAWTGLAAPKGTPTEIIDKLNRETKAALVDPKMKARFAELGGVALPGLPTNFGNFIVGETEKWRKVIRATNIKMN
jgi:tripartite-type tricarboxylate transporter receptor subunit TctC